MVKKNVIKLILFLIPFLIYILLIAILDPFNYFNMGGLIPGKIKGDISPVINECLWKVIDYNRNPGQSILLGDSRMALVNKDTVRIKYKRKFYDLSYASASLKEIINSFWFICEKNRIDTVFIAISLEKYNQTFIRDRVEGAISVLSNPLLYFSNYNVPQASYLCLKEFFSESNISLNKPEITNEEFWEYQIDVSGKKYYSSYIYPQVYYDDLQKISSYCSNNGIKLVFIIFPVHKDLQDLVSLFKLEAENETFINDISEFGEIIDFCFVNTITADKKYFSDPFHIRRDVFNRYFLPRLFAKNNYSVNDTLVKYYHQLGN
jgi:hypothetical protein